MNLQNQTRYLILHDFDQESISRDSVKYRFMLLNHQTLFGRKHHSICVIFQLTSPPRSSLGHLHFCCGGSLLSSTVQSFFSQIAFLLVPIH